MSRLGIPVCRCSDAYAGGCWRFEARRDTKEDREANGATDKTGKAPHELADETAKDNEGRRVETTGA